jgi:cobalt-zinc-cadmium efflux system protein
MPSTESQNLKGAYFEVLSDMLSSLGVIAAGLIMWATNWYYADPLFSAGIGSSSSRGPGPCCVRPSACC